MPASCISTPHPLVQSRESHSISMHLPVHLCSSHRVSSHLTKARAWLLFSVFAGLPFFFLSSLLHIVCFFLHIPVSACLSLTYVASCMQQSPTSRMIYERQHSPHMCVATTPLFFVCISSCHKCLFALHPACDVNPPLKMCCQCQGSNVLSCNGLLLPLLSCSCLFCFFPLYVCSA